MQELLEQTPLEQVPLELVPLVWVMLEQIPLELTPLILYPFESVKLTIRVLGIILLIDSVSDLLTIRSYSKTAKNIKKVIDMK